MKAFISYLRQYLQQQSYKSFFLTIFFVAALVTINYTFGIERRILALRPWYYSLAGFFVFYGGVLGVAWGLQWRPGQAGSAAEEEDDLESVSARGPGKGWAPGDRQWWVLLALAPLYFAFKMIHWNFLPFLPAELSQSWTRYALIVLQLPAKLLLLLALIYGCWKAGLLEGRLPEVAGPWAAVGLTRRGFTARPYFFLLLCLVPLIALASTQSDFLRVYPKVKNIAFIGRYASPIWPWKLLYELTYGLDFLSIELFFRGFLVIGLLRYAGTSARGSSDLLRHGPHSSAPSLGPVLPMAAFYCTIHFGKPLGECISSFFGGLILGVLAARTRSILGGLMVHLGLAWLMEIGGWLAGP